MGIPIIFHENSILMYKTSRVEWNMPSCSTRRPKMALGRLSLDYMDGDRDKLPNHEWMLIPICHHND